MPATARLKNRKAKRHTGGRFHDILETAHLLSLSTVPEKVAETVLAHLCERLGKRSRCVLLEGDELRLSFWAGEHSCPLEGLKVVRGSVVWDAVRKGVAVNLTDPRQTNGYAHTLAQPIKIKSVIPLMYTDPLTGQPKKLGALIVDSGQAGEPISEEDFEYLQVVGELISAILGRAELIRQLMTSCRRQEAILMETVHNFRNSIAVIGGFALRVAQLAEDTELADRATHLHEEVKTLEGHVAVFEKYMSVKP
jgi:GAF domain-containing protein